jgi:probable F420-dependent oxidoreductase
MKIDAAMLVQNPMDAKAVGSELEQSGFDGIYSLEGPHDPFLPLAMAANTTERIELLTGIAVAFARNPMILANLGYDMNFLSGGRFILGLGTQIRPHIENRFSMTWSKPASRMREMVQAIRAIWDSWEGNSKLDFRGEFYTHTIMNQNFNPGPNPAGLPKIYLAGFGEKMVEVVGEVGDGFLIHPLHTRKFLLEYSLPALQRGLDKAGRSRDSFDVSVQCLSAIGETKEELEEAKKMVRHMISFYGSTPAYRPALDAEGLGELQPQLNKLSKEGDWAGMSALITDEVLETIAITGTPDEVAEKLIKRYGDFAQRLAPVGYSTNKKTAKATLIALKKRLG